MQSAKTIPLKDVLESMDAGNDFSMAWVTSDDKRDTGGEWIEVKQARKHDWTTPQEARRLERAQPKDLRVKRNPHHYENSTRNIIMPNGEIRKVAIRLIRRFNGMVVM